MLIGGYPFLYGVVDGKYRIGWDSKIGAVVRAEIGVAVIDACVGPITVDSW